MNDPVQEIMVFPTVLMAEDDEDDRFFMDDVFRSIKYRGELRFVENGEALMSYLRRQGKFSDPSLSPRPALVLLDLNMPKKDGRQALLEIKADLHLKEIPIVIWTTSNLPEDQDMCMKAGAEAYFTKPDNYLELEKTVKTICTKWLGLIHIKIRYYTHFPSDSRI